MRRGSTGSGALLIGTLALTAASTCLGCTFPDYTVGPIDDGGVPLDDTDVPTADSLPADVSADGDARDALADGDAPAADVDAESGSDASDDGETPDGCGRVQQFNYPLGSVTNLKCSSFGVVLDITLPVGTEGMAFARANLILQHAAIPKISYSWSAKLEVGAADTNQIAFASGDDVCPTTTTSRVVGGFGKLDATNLHVKLSAFQSALLCSAGTLSLQPTSSIDVWVESSKPECVGKAIQVASYLKLVGSTGGAFDWPLSAVAAPILTAKIDTAASDTSLLTLATIEGTAVTNPNTTCGVETGTLTVQTTLDGPTVLSSSKLPMPATTGAGHLLLDLFHQAPVPPGTHTIQLLAGRDFATSKVSTGGTGGDAMLAVIRK